MGKEALESISAKRVMPDGVQVFRKAGQDNINSVRDFTLIPGAGGFEVIRDIEAPGGDITLAFFRTNAEVQAFRKGFECSGPADDFSFTTERIKLRGRNVFAFLGHDSDSGADALRLENYI